MRRARLARAGRGGGDRAVAGGHRHSTPAALHPARPHLHRALRRAGALATISWSATSAASRSPIPRSSASAPTPRRSSPRARGGRSSPSVARRGARRRPWWPRWSACRSSASPSTRSPSARSASRWSPRIVATNWVEVTRGPLCITGIPKPSARRAGDHDAARLLLAGAHRAGGGGAAVPGAHDVPAGPRVPRRARQRAAGRRRRHRSPQVPDAGLRHRRRASRAASARSTRTTSRCCARRR